MTDISTHDKGENRDLPIEGLDFIFVETEDKDVMERSRNPIVSLRNQYQGVIVQYGKIELKWDETPPRIAFDFTVLNAGRFNKEELLKDASFKNTLGDIIVVTIEDTVKKANDEARNNNSESTGQE
jgi:hypothetical protein